MTHGLLLAAGAGTRMGMPKALVRDDDGRPWLTRSVQVLVEGGCDGVTVVLGASGDEAERLLVDGLLDLTRVHVVRALAWQAGMGESLRAGLQALTDVEATAALVHLVDLPDVSAAVIKRVLAAAVAGPDVLARASYEGKPGHPVLLGRDHWRPVSEEATGDRGARDYLTTREVALVECGDLATGIDEDRPTTGQRPTP